MKLIAWVVLLLVLLHEVSANQLFALTDGPRNTFVVVNIDNTTGDYTVIATQKPIEQELFMDTKCYDPATNTLFYTGSQYFFAIDLNKKKDALKYVWLDVFMVTTMVWDPVESRILMSVCLPQTRGYSYGLMSYSPDGGKPTQLANLTSLGLSEQTCNSEVFDPKSRILYTVSSVFTGENMPLGIKIQELNVSNPVRVESTTYTCVSSVTHLDYDTVQQQLVGVGTNITVTNETTFIEVFTIEIANGECIRSPVTLINRTSDVIILTSATYDSQLSTFYIYYSINQNMGIFIFNTKTLEVKSIPINYIIYELQVVP